MRDWNDAELAELAEHRQNALALGWAAREASASALRRSERMTAVVVVLGAAAVAAALTLARGAVVGVSRGG